MTDFTTDELITMAESMAELAIAGGMSGSAAAGMFYRLIARIRQQDETIKRMGEALKPFVDEADSLHKLALGPDIDHWALTNSSLTLGDLRRAQLAARAARKEQSDG